jgi:hypothetical protein
LSVHDFGQKPAFSKLEIHSNFENNMVTRQSVQTSHPPVNSQIEKNVNKRPVEVEDRQSA